MHNPIFWISKAMKQYASFKGRAQRAEYWYFTLFYALTYLAARFIDEALGTTSRHEGGTGLITFLTSFGLFIPAIAVSARRLHDIGKSGWWQLIAVVPVIGFLVIVAFAIRDSDLGSNKYGPNPKTE
ncbi:DUF805 domain-containing protein [Aquabacterium sp.]|uniref:DUF805 domain-containing protein n=1 Tax=Aquabacterium sp. TaxID=1872578 RepID=UPI002E345B58|nr:DUF805 domain-containing protein [Aquabacterium sp.]HEX5310806.1 DUF805 domain-containing protein [Aquabacterium sp.]